MKSRLFVGGLAEEATEDELTRLFAPFGEISFVSIIKDRESGKPRGFGFVQLGNDEQAQKAIEALHGSRFLGRELRVLVAEPKGPKAGGNQTNEIPAMSREPEPAVAETEPEPEFESEPERLTPLRASIPPSLNPFAETTPIPSRRNLVPWLAFVGVVLALGVLLGRTLFTETLPEAAPGTLLILPFDVFGQASGGDYLGSAFAQALAVNLAEVEKLKVLPVPRLTDVEAVAADDRARFARRRGAGRLVLGTLTRKQNGQAHVSLTLVDSVENRILWGVQEEGNEDEIMGLAATLSRRIGETMGVTFPQLYVHVTDLSGGPAMASSPLLAKALAVLRRNEIEPSLEATNALYESFPTDPAAMALRSLALMLAFDADGEPDDRVALERMLDRLEATGHGYPYADFFRANLLYYDARVPEAMARFTQLLERGGLAPAARAWVLRFRAFGKQRARDLPGALSDLEESHRLDPTSAVTHGMLSNVLYLLGRHEEALTRARQGQAIAPSSWRNSMAEGHALLALDRDQEAVAPLDRACTLARSQMACALWAVALIHSGQKDEAKKAAEHSRRLFDTVWGAYNLACYYALAAQTEPALEYFERAVKLGLDDLTPETDTDLDRIRGEPKFGELLEVVRGRLARVEPKP